MEEPQVSRINWSRVLLGGLVAGVIINASGITLAHFVLGEEYVKALTAKMIHRPLWQIMTQHLSMRFWFGILAVFLYAAMRPRFGPGPGTALIAALTLFLSVGLVLTLNLYGLGVLYGQNVVIAPLWTAVETVLATMVGAWIYREQPVDRGF